MSNQAKRLAERTLLQLARGKSCCYYSTATAAATKVTSSSSSKGQAISLARKLLAPNAVVSDTLDEWVTGGRSIKRHDIIVSVNVLRKANKYHHALQLHEWMEKRKIQMNNADRAIHIDILDKTEGVGSAVEYFDSLEESEKTNRTYGALLGCYCKEKMIERATELFEKLKKLNFNSTLNYNNMMTLYSSIGEPEKVLLLEKEMEEMNIAASAYTYNQLIDCHDSMKDIDSVEKVLEKMRAKKAKPDWFTFEKIATIYVNAGLTNKALDALTNLETMHKPITRDILQTLITLYARMNNSEGVARTWETLKTISGKPSSVSYLVMLLALRKLKDVDGLEKMFLEWESSCSESDYDVRIANVLIESYLDRDMIDKANEFCESLKGRGIEPNLRTLTLFTNYYLKNQKMDLALKFFEIGTSKVKSEKDKWFPNDETLGMFMKLIEAENSEENTEKFYGIMKQIGRFDSINESKEV